MSKPMTNYNERLDEILMAYKRYPYGTSAAPHISGDEAKQAITSLIKELVAEAEPERFTLKTGLLWDSQDCTDGYHEAIKDYEANLLKVLEEV